MEGLCHIWFLFILCNYFSYPLIFSEGIMSCFVLVAIYCVASKKVNCLIPCRQTIAFTKQSLECRRKFGRNTRIPLTLPKHRMLRYSVLHFSKSNLAAGETSKWLVRFPQNLSSRTHYDRAICLFD